MRRLTGELATICAHRHALRSPIADHDEPHLGPRSSRLDAAHAAGPRAGAGGPLALDARAAAVRGRRGARRHLPDDRRARGEEQQVRRHPQLEHGEHRPRRHPRRRRGRPLRQRPQAHGAEGEEGEAEGGGGGLLVQHAVAQAARRAEARGAGGAQGRGAVVQRAVFERPSSRRRRAEVRGAGECQFEARRSQIEAPAIKAPELPKFDAPKFERRRCPNSTHRNSRRQVRRARAAQVQRSRDQGARAPEV